MEMIRRTGQTFTKGEFLYVMATSDQNERQIAVCKQNTLVFVKKNGDK